MQVAPDPPGCYGADDRAQKAADILANRYLDGEESGEYSDRLICVLHGGDIARSIIGIADGGGFGSKVLWCRSLHDAKQVALREWLEKKRNELEALEYKLETLGGRSIPLAEEIDQVRADIAAEEKGLRPRIQPKEDDDG